MIAGFLNIVCHHILKGQHTIHIHITGAGDQISLVGIFARQLEADQMAPVVEIFTIHKIILGSDPAGGFYLADIAPVFRRHQISANAGHGIGASVQRIQIFIIFIAFGGYILLGKQRDVAIEDCKSLAAEFRHLRQGDSRNYLRSRLRQNQIQDQQQDDHQCRTKRHFLFHRAYLSTVIFSWELPGNVSVLTRRIPSRSSLGNLTVAG